MFAVRSRSEMTALGPLPLFVPASLRDPCAIAFADHWSRLRACVGTDNCEEQRMRTLRGSAETSGHLFDLSGLTTSRESDVIESRLRA